MARRLWYSLAQELPCLPGLGPWYSLTQELWYGMALESWYFQVVEYFGCLAPCLREQIALVVEVGRVVSSASPEVEEVGQRVASAGRNSCFKGC